MKRIGKALLGLVLLVVVAVGVYVAYAFGTYYRLEDGLPLEIKDNQSPRLAVGTSYQALSYNLGFGAYSADYSFFMDGGTESRAFSRQAVFDNLAGAVGLIQELEPDLLLLQEVDIGSHRSYQVEEREVLTGKLKGYGSVFAQNYDSPYLFYPLQEPHGKSKSGLLTLSRFSMDSSLRRSLPVETGVTKFLDLDRCYSVTRLPVEGGGELCLYSVHLSAYTSDGTVVVRQLEQLLADMAAERAAGNYVIGGGDFNQDLLGNSAELFGVAGEAFTWANPFPTELLPEGIRLVSSLEGEPVPSCRNADSPYVAGESFVVTVDGFLVSDNVNVENCRVVDSGFAWSDHNPVELVFSLEEKTF